MKNGYNIKPRKSSGYTVKETENNGYTINLEENVNVLEDEQNGE